MNRKTFLLLSAAAALACGLAANTPARTIESDDLAPATTPTQDLRPRPDPGPSRLRCWQHGVSIVDEPITEGQAAPGVTLFAGVTTLGQQVIVVGTGSSLCLATFAQGRVSKHKIGQE